MKMLVAQIIIIAIITTPVVIFGISYDNDVYKKEAQVSDPVSQYGLQSQNRFWGSDIQYQYTSKETESYKIVSSSSAKSEADGIVSKYLLFSEEDRHRLEVGLYPEGLGDFSYSLNEQKELMQLDR